jgi:hypothetical protein
LNSEHSRYANRRILYGPLLVTGCLDLQRSLPLDDNFNVWGAMPMRLEEGTQAMG